ncbi:ABC transporter permease [Luteimonas sp. SDU101]|uniref:ABC transporter permease n=1 Tax=unclassified Luteimonas TaxID=2629088 RepID=UPI003EC0C679
MDGAIAGNDAEPLPPTRRLWRDLAESFRNPGFWALSSWLDILVRSRKSYLGPLWLLAPGIVYVFGIGAFFASMFGRSIPEFAVHVSLGIVVFRTMTSALVGSAGVFTANQSFILDGHVRLTDFVLQSLARSAFDMLMTVPVVVAALLLYGQANLAGLLLAVPVLLLIYLNAFWISVAFALVGARFVDFGQALATVSMFLFLLTPIIWYPESVPEGSIRAKLMLFNPLYHFVEVFRGPIVGSAVQPVSLWVVGVSTAGGLLLATLLYRRYARFVPLWI